MLDSSQLQEQVNKDKNVKKRRGTGRTNGPKSKEEGDDLELARQVSGNPFSRQNSQKRGLDDQTDWDLGGGLFNNLSQLDEDTRKKINEEYTRQDWNDNDQSNGELATKDQSNNEGKSTDRLKQLAINQKSTSSSRDPGEFLADEVAQIMRQDQNPKDLNQILKYSTLNTKQWSDESSKPPIVPDNIKKNSAMMTRFKERNNSTLPEIELNKSGQFSTTPKYQRNSAIAATMIHVTTVLEVAEQKPFAPELDNFKRTSSNFNTNQIESRDYNPAPGTPNQVSHLQSFHMKTQGPSNTNSKSSILDKKRVSQTPSKLADVFNVRPSTSGSGIGGILNLIGDQTERSNTEKSKEDKSNHDYKMNMNTTHQANAGSPIKFERGLMRKWINNPKGIQSPGIFHPKLEITKSKHSQLIPISPEMRTSKQNKDFPLKPLLDQQPEQPNVELDKFSQNEFKRRLSKMSQNNNTQDEESKPNSNLDLLNIDEGDIQVRSNLNLVELEDVNDQHDKQSDLSKTGHGWIKDKDFRHQHSALQVDLQQTQSTLDGLLGNNFADRVKQMHLLHEEEELVLDDKDPKKAKLRKQLMRKQLESESKRDVIDDLDNLEKNSIRNLKVPSPISKKSPINKKQSVSIKSKIDRSECGDKSDIMKSTQHQWNFVERDRINKEIAEERCSKPNLESIRKTKLPMNNTAMNFNMSLFDQSHAVPDDHFIETREDELESRDDDDFNRQRSRIPTIVTSNEDMQNKTSNLTAALMDPNKVTNSKMRDTFARESSFDAQSASQLEAEECYKSFMRKQNQEHYQTKGLGFIPGMRDKSSNNASPLKSQISNNFNQQISGSTSQFDRDDQSLMDESLIDQYLKQPGPGEAKKRPSVRFQGIDNPDTQRAKNKSHVEPNYQPPSFGYSFKDRSNTVRKADKPPILEQNELDDAEEEIQQMNKKAEEQNNQHVARSEYTYNKYRDEDRESHLDDEEAEKLLSEFVSRGDYRNIDDDVVSVISAKIPMLNKQKQFIPQVMDNQVLLESEQNAMIVEEFMKQIDYSLNTQVFNGPNEKPKKELDIKKQAQLGSGSQGDVYKVRIKGMRGSYVDKMRKVHNNKQLADQVLSDMYSEFCIAKDLCHPNIVEYKYFMRTYDAATKEYEFHILMELLEGGDMDCYIREQGKAMTIQQVKEIGSQIISGIRYLHCKKIIHQDLKPPNILFSSDYDLVKLVDLGVSHKLDKTKATKAANQGTLRYMPPEQLNGVLCLSTDIWAFGCVLLQFCTGMKPFNEIENEVAVSFAIFQGQSPLDHALKNYDPEDVELINDNEDFKQLLQKCLTADYKVRPTSDEICNDPFFDGYFDYSDDIDEEDEDDDDDDDDDDGN